MGNYSSPVLQTPAQGASNLSANDPAAPSFASMEAILEKEVYNLVKYINVSKSSGLENVSTFIVKEAFSALFFSSVFFKQFYLP